ncbi:hypothetical protein [Variovorax rhizosphaerae]|uniref:Uncharacterized protein n=1 Tax=Variovorax rhizosphaerae TaxID=1836200 RepID=A0ABU8WYV8_9BURK
MLLKIDKRLRTARLHREDCKRIPSPVGSVHKPIGKLGRDGGWFSVTSEAEASAVARTNFPQAKFDRCQFCQTTGKVAGSAAVVTQ